MSEKNRFIGLYNLPGEGLVAEIITESGAHLYDRRGLQFRILDLKQTGEDASAEEFALLQMNSVSLDAGSR